MTHVMLKVGNQVSHGWVLVKVTISGVVFETRSGSLGEKEYYGLSEVKVEVAPWI